MLSFEDTVSAESAGMRLDVYLAQREMIPSRNAAVHLIEDGGVSVNGTPVLSKKQVLEEGDLVSYYVKEESDAVPKELVGEAIPLDIRFEDDHLLVISKQAGLVCHPSSGHEGGTLVHALIAHCGIDNLARLQGGDRPGIVHRLDMDTTGLMLAAKDDATGMALQDAIRTRNLDRRYLALVHGYIAPDTGMVDAPIARDGRDRLKMRVSDSLSARSSVTTFSVLERFDAGPVDDGYTLLECKLYTGRTHQIRVHMAYIGHPCVGDPLYGNARPKAEHGLERQFLHSYSLEFEHPVTKEQMLFLDPLPEDLASFLRMLEDEGRSMGRTRAGEEILSRLEG